MVRKNWQFHIFYTGWYTPCCGFAKLIVSLHIQKCLCVSMTYLRAKIPREYAKMDMKWIATKTFKNEGAPFKLASIWRFFRCREDHWKIILSPGSLFPKVLRGHLSPCSFHCCRPAVAFSAGFLCIVQSNSSKTSVEITKVGPRCAVPQKRWVVSLYRCFWR